MDFRPDIWQVLKLYWHRAIRRVSDELIASGHNDDLIRVRRGFYQCLYRVNIFAQRFGKTIMRTIDTLTIMAAVWCLLNFVWQLGFNATPEVTANLLTSNRICISFFGVVQIIKFFGYWKSSSKIPISEIIYALVNWVYIYLSHKESFAYYDFLNYRYVVCCVAALIAVNEISRLGLSTLSKRTSPTVLFIGSFLFIIAVGTGLLMMPRCHVGNISFLEALFTATSSVCVTGISIVDMPTAFTSFGHIVILLLIQVGGLGVMTFTCFFALSLNGRATLQNRIVIRDLISVENMTDIFTTLKRIFYVTLTIETACALLIYARLSAHNTDMDTYDIIFTSVFHAVSAFCNAGISNVEGGLSNEMMGGGRTLMLIVATTAFIGGAGFPLQSNTIDWIKHRCVMLFDRLRGKYTDHVYRSRLINANSRLMFFSHMGLFIVGAIAYYLTEMRYTMAEQTVGQSIGNSLFMSAISRSSGFGFEHMEQMSSLSMLVMGILMWIGCAPLSTGGGVKTTTVALLFLNMRNALVRKENIEIFGRRVSGHSLRRAFATVFASGLTIIVSAVAMKVADPQIRFTTLLFDSNAALSTAGMTIGNAAELSVVSKGILIADMFVGRIGVLAFIACFCSPAEKQHYQYPTENIMI